MVVGQTTMIHTHTHVFHGQVSRKLGHFRRAPCHQATTLWKNGCRSECGHGRGGPVSNLPLDFCRPKILVTLQMHGLPNFGWNPNFPARVDPCMVCFKDLQMLAVCRLVDFDQQPQNTSPDSVHGKCILKICSVKRLSPSLHLC